MKTYSELHSEWVYDWPQIIDDLEAGAYDDRQQAEVSRAAGTWVTCACGNQCVDIPRSKTYHIGGYTHGGSPADGALRDKGSEFFRLIDMLCGHNDGYLDVGATANAARECLAAIEQRATELLRTKP